MKKCNENEKIKMEFDEKNNVGLNTIINNSKIFEM